MVRILVLVALLLTTALLPGQTSSSLSPVVKPFVTVDACVFALTHVRVIDGTGAPAREDQTIVVADGKIAAIGDAAKTQLPAGARVMEMRDYSVIRGLRIGP